MTTKRWTAQVLIPLILALGLATGCATSKGSKADKTPAQKSPARTTSAEKTPSQPEAKEDAPTGTKADAAPGSSEKKDAKPAEASAPDEYSDEKIQALITDIEALVEKIRSSTGTPATPAESK